MDSWRWIHGEVGAEVHGTASQRFFSLLLQNDIACWQVQEKHGKYYFSHPWKDRSRVQKYAGKTGMYYRERYQRGLPSALQRWKKKPYAIIGIMMAVLMVAGFHQFIWKIEIEGNEWLTRHEIEERLQKMDVHEGVWKRKVKAKEVTEQLLQQYKDLSYASVTLEGATLKVVVKEKNEKPEMVYLQEESGSLVAKGRYLIYSIVAETGTPMVKKGDVVQEGDVLISGYVKETADDGTITYKEKKAEGTVLGISEFRFQDHLDAVGEVRVYEDTVQNALAFFYNARQIYLWNPFSNAGNYDIISNELLSVELFGKEFQIYHEEYQAYKMVPYEYTSEDMERLIAERLDYAAGRWLAENEFLEVERLWDFENVPNGMDGTLNIRVIEDITKEAALETLPMHENTGGN